MYSFCRFNPQHMSKVANILRSGAVMETRFDIFEASLQLYNHLIPYQGAYSFYTAGVCG